MRKEVIKPVKAFRIFVRSIRDSVKSVFRNFSLSIASILCTTITLVLVAIAIVVTVNVNHVTKDMEEELTIVVYANEETTDEQLKTLEKEIKNISTVKKVVAKSKEEWRLEMKSYSDTLNTTLDYLEENPLLDSFIVTVDNVDDLRPTALKIRDLDNIESANYGEGMVEDIISVFDIIKTVTIVMVVALIVVTAFLISNTIKLTIFSRRSEIEIMRLVGSSNTSIKLPFVFEGFLLGLLGSIIPIIVTIYGYLIMYEQLSTSSSFSIIELVKPMPFVLITSLVLLVIGSVVGMFGSARAVRKYLKI
ncbi:efflux ABC transporter permease protein [Mycoplasma sp. CAG:776]|nr:efflux ABC transporter permease protein [Mycoplasma sp. CAG:776]